MKQLTAKQIMGTPKDIEDLRNHLYTSGEKLWWLSFWVVLGTQALMLVALWINNASLVAVVSFIALAAPILIAWLREKANTAVLRADRCRRLILYAEGLGRPITGEELSEVRAWGMGSIVEDADFVAPYYTSEKPVGPNRLADITAESSFFTCQLSERVLGTLWLVLLLSLCMVFTILFLSDILTPLERQDITGPIINLAKSMAIVIAFLLSGDFLLLIKKYSDLRSMANDTFRQCVSLRDNESLQEPHMRWIIENYNIGLIQSPPIPDMYYRKYKDELNNIYRESHGLKVS